MQRDRDACAYVVPQLAECEHVEKKHGRRRKEKEDRKMNEKRKSKIKEEWGQLAVGVKTKAANNDRKLPPTLHEKTRRAHVLKNTDNAENRLNCRSKC